jgi:hypothetical protein
MRNFTRAILIIITVILNCAFIKGQNNYITTQIGFKGGINISQLYMYPIIDQQFIKGACIGLVFRHFHEKYFGIQIEANYSQKGWNEIIDAKHSYLHRLNYYEMPVLASFRTVKKKVGLIIELGPGLAKLKDDELTTQNFDITVFSKSNIYPKNIDKKFDFTLNGGAGISYKFGKSALQFEVRYCQSILDLYHYNSNVARYVSNQVISISLAYLFML